MLNVDVSSMSLGVQIHQLAEKSNNNVKSSKDITFDSYMQSIKKDKSDVCKKENTMDKKIDEDIKEDNNIDKESDEVKDDVSSVVGVSVNVVEDKEALLEDALVYDSDLLEGVSLDGTEDNLLDSSIELVNDADLDTLNNILGEKGSNDISIDYIEYDYIEKGVETESLTIDDIVVPNNMLNTNTNATISNYSNVSEVSVATSPIEVTQDMFVNDMLSNIDYMAKEGIQRLKIQLSPKDLGNMMVEIIRTAESSKMVLTLSKEDLYSVVQNNIKELNSQLDVLNIKVDEVSVELKTDLDNGFMAKDAESENRDHNRKNGGQGLSQGDNKGIENIVSSNKRVNIIKDDKVLLCV